MRLRINTSFALSAVSIPENDGGGNEELFTIRRALAHVLTIILLLAAGISEANADQHLSDYQLRQDVESTLIPVASTCMAVN